MEIEKRLKSNKLIGKIFIEKLKLFTTGFTIGCILTVALLSSKLRSSLLLI